MSRVQECSLGSTSLAVAFPEIAPLFLATTLRSTSTSTSDSNALDAPDTSSRASVFAGLRCNVCCEASRLALALLHVHSALIERSTKDAEDADRFDLALPENAEYLLRETLRLQLVGPF